MTTYDIICFSGGEGSALAALEVAAKKGTDNLILLNHDINVKKESSSVKQFKRSISEYIGVPVTYANIDGIADVNLIPNQFDVCMKAGALTDNAGNALCTSRLKTEPFYRYLSVNFPALPSLFEGPKQCTIHYGFSLKEMVRIVRRTSLLGAMGYRTDYPLTWQDRRYSSTNDIGIAPPLDYEVYEHANCKGCLKASLLHWYVTYVHEPDTYMEGIIMEEDIDFTIHTVTRNGVKQPISLTTLAIVFNQMVKDGVPATEHQSKKLFANLIKKYQIEECATGMPCECTE